MIKFEKRKCAFSGCSNHFKTHKKNKKYCSYDCQIAASRIRNAIRLESAQALLIAEAEKRGFDRGYAAGFEAARSEIRAIPSAVPKHGATQGFSMLGGRGPQAKAPAPGIPVEIIDPSSGCARM